MNLNETINKIKLNLFGNPWTVWLVKILRYAGGGALFYFISKSPYLFSGNDFFSVLKQMLNWHERSLESFLSNFWTLVLVIFFLTIYFFLSGILVEWLIRIELAPHQQIQILSQKTYSIKKENYSANLDQLEITAYFNSSHTSLKGSFAFHNKQKRGKVNFVGYSHANVLKPYLSPSNLENNLTTTEINFREKTLFPWQKVVLAIILYGGVLFAFRVKDQAKSLPEGYKLGDILKGQAAQRAKEAEQDKKNKESKEERLRQARITPHTEIKATWDSIGGLKKAKMACREIAEAIVERNRLLKEGKGCKPLREPEHILLYGPPGTGKTLLAKAMAKHVKGFFLDLSGADFQNDFAQIFSGKSINVEEKIRAIFDIAINEAQGETVIALIDEIDRMGGERLAGDELLRILSGTKDDKYKNIIIVATTNHKNNLTKALLRPGRLAKKELVNFPNEKELLEIIDLNLRSYYKEKNPHHPQAFNNDTEDDFVRKFAKPIQKLMTQTKYVVTYKDMRIKSDKINPDEGRVLFTGASVERMIQQAASHMGERMTLKLSDFEKSIQRVYEDSRKEKRRGWWDDAKEFIMEEIDIQLDEDDLPSRKQPQKKPRPGDDDY